MAKKRANVEGNIRKRKDGRWEGRYTAGYDPATGKRIIKNVLDKTQAEVKKKLALAIDSTKDLDVARMDDYTVPRIGSIKLAKLTAHDLQRLYKDLQENGRVHPTKRAEKD